MMVPVASHDFGYPVAIHIDRYDLHETTSCLKHDASLPSHNWIAYRLRLIPELSWRVYALNPTNDSYRTLPRGTHPEGVTPRRRLQEEHRP